MKKSTSRYSKAAKKASAKKLAAKKYGGFKKAAKRSNFGARKMQRTLPYLEVKNADYVRANVLLITFSNGIKKQVDFSSFFLKNDIPYLNKYKRPSNFKKFKVEDGNVVWGEDWDLIFPIEQLYNGVIK